MMNNCISYQERVKIILLRELGVNLLPHLLVLPNHEAQSSLLVEIRPKCLDIICQS